MTRRLDLIACLSLVITAMTFLSGCTLLVGAGAGVKEPQCPGSGVRVNMDSMPDRIGVWVGDQLINAALIVNAGATAGISLRDQQIAVMTAMQESSLRNIDYGDWETSGVTNPDNTPTSSLGLFQQQDWWGSRDERLDPTTAAATFYRALSHVENRDTMPPWEVAHRVQRNQSATDYEDDWIGAQQIVAALVDVASGTVVSGGSGWSTPMGVPYVLTSNFGLRELSVGGQDVSDHNGQDFGAATGSPVLAVADGTVVRVWDDGQVWGGKQVTISHGDRVESWYAHLSAQRVSVGQHVTAGQQIGDVGSTGYATGPHLHLTIKYDSVPIDPVVFLFERGVILDGTPGTSTGVSSCI